MNLSSKTSNFSSVAILVPCSGKLCDYLIKYFGIMALKNPTENNYYKIVNYKKHTTFISEADYENNCSCFTATRKTNLYWLPESVPNIVFNNKHFYNLAGSPLSCWNYRPKRTRGVDSKTVHACWH